MGCFVLTELYRNRKYKASCMTLVGLFEVNSDNLSSSLPDPLVLKTGIFFVLP